MKSCPTCGCEIGDAATICESCEAWAAALVEGRPSGDETPDAEVSMMDAPRPAASAARVPNEKTAGPRREVLFIAAGAAVVALTGFAMLFARGSSAPSAPAAAAATAAAPHAAPTAAATAAAAAPAAGVQRWNTENRESWLGGARRGAAFELPAENIVRTWFGPLRPSLVVRCTKEGVDAFVFTGSPMKIEPRVEGKTVTISVDGEPVRTERWPDSDRHDALFAPDGAAFAERLRHARSLQFGYSPHNSSDVVAQFAVSGLDALVGAASKECSPRR